MLNKIKQFFKANSKSITPTELNVKKSVATIHLKNGKIVTATRKGYVLSIFHEWYRTGTELLNGELRYSKFFKADSKEYFLTTDIDYYIVDEEDYYSK